MPDPIQLLESLAAAAVIAIMLSLACGWPWRAPSPRRSAVGSTLGVGLGFLVGCRVLGVVVHWPPREDQDRLLFVVFPAAIVVELIAATSRSKPLASILRCLIAACVAPVLLYNTSYIADLNGPGSREWTVGQAALTFGGLAALLITVWGALSHLLDRAPGRSVTFALSMAAGAAALTVMLSGYGSGGQIGFPLGAALLGAIIGSLPLKGAPPKPGMLGLGLVGVFSLLVMGRFFGQLPTSDAALILCGLLACWLPELPPIRGARARVRGALRIVLTAIPLAIAVFLVGQTFFAEAQAAHSDPAEPSADDYINFRG